MRTNDIDARAPHPLIHGITAAADAARRHRTDTCTGRVQQLRPSLSAPWPECTAASRHALRVYVYATEPPSSTGEGEGREGWRDRGGEDGGGGRWRQNCDGDDLRWPISVPHAQWLWLLRW